MVGRGLISAFSHSQTTLLQELVFYHGGSHATIAARISSNVATLALGRSPEDCFIKAFLTFATPSYGL